MARMQELTPQDLDDKTRELGERIAKTRGGSIQGPWAHMLRNPELAARAAHYSDFFGEGLSIPRKLALLAVIMTARHWNAGYVWNAQTRHAKAAGISDAVIEAIRTKKTPGFSETAEEAVYRLFSEMYSRQRVDDSTYAAAVKVLGETGLIEILNYAGFYGIIASIVNVTGVALRAGHSDPFV